MGDLTIDPGTPGVGSTSPTDAPSAPPMTPLSSAPPVDSMSAASLATNPDSVFFLLAPRTIDLNSYIKSVKIPLKNSHEQITSDYEQDQKRLTQARYDLLKTADGLINLQARMDVIASMMQTEYNHETSFVSSVNGSINSYNSSVSSATSDDQTQINNMASATDDYNHGTIDAPTYNLAIQQYTNYVNSRNGSITAAQGSVQSTYSGGVGAINTEIRAINHERDLASIPDIPELSVTPPTVPTQPALPPPPSVSNPTFPAASATPPTSMSTLPFPTSPPTASDLTALYITPILDSIASTQIDASKALDDLTAHKDEDQQAYFTGPQQGKVDAPVSFVERTDKSTVEPTSSSGAASGVGMTSLTAGLSNPTLNRLLSNAIAKDIALEDQLSIPPKLLDNLRLINHLILGRAGVTSGPLSLGIVGDRLTTLDPSSEAIKVAVAFAFLKQIRGLTSHGDLHKVIVRGLKEANPSADPKQIDAAADKLASLANISTLLHGPAALAKALDFPQLPALLLSTIDHPAIQAATQPALQQAALQVASRPIERETVNPQTSSLAASPLEGQRSRQDQIDAIIRNIDLSDIQDRDQLRASIREHAISQGLTDKEATSLAASLEQRIGERNQQLIAEGNQQQSETDLRALLSQAQNPELVRRRTTLQPSIAATSEIPRSEILASSTLPSLADVHAQIASHIQNALSPELGPEQGQFYASLMTRHLTETAQQVGEQIKSLDKTSTARTTEHITALTKELTAPSTDQTAYIGKLTDPGHQLTVALAQEFQHYYRHTGWLDVAAG